MCRSLAVVVSLVFAISDFAAAQNGNLENRSKNPTQDPTKLALLIGVSDYFDKNMEDLRYAENDVTVIGNELRKLGFKVTVLTGKNASRADADRELTAFLKSTEKLENNDIVFVMFSGHGQQLMALQKKRVTVNGKVETLRRKVETPYFCPRDAKPYDPLRHTLAEKTESEIAKEFNLISLNRVIGELDVRSNSRRNLLVVDACRNNPAKGKTANITGSIAREIPNGMSMLFAAKSGQKSWESSDPKIKHGVMSHFLIQGLRGKAVTRRNEVTWKRLVAYVSEEVEYDQGKIAGAGDRIQNPHAVGNSNLIVLGKWRETYTSATTGMEFVLIPKGTFLMGSPEGEIGRIDNELQHKVTISKNYFMGVHEVTQGQWKSVMGTEPWIEGGRAKIAVKVGKNYPVTYVSWDDAVSFCKKLSLRDGVKYRLPTEAEWERACRAGSQTRYSFGESDSKLGQYAWFNELFNGIGNNYAHLVGQKKPNALGLHDMHGNVYEWCSDYYDKDYYSNSVAVDPQGASPSNGRVFRGGCWGYDALGCRSACRYEFKPSDRNSLLGFRCVLVQESLANKRNAD